MTPPKGRPRADALRNRARVLEAAETVFAAKGTSASTEEVARLAGVGIGTVFRHFPTKEALLEEVFVGRLHRLADQAEALLTADDPGAAFFGFFREVIAQSAGKNAVAEALAEAGIDVLGAAAEAKPRVHAALGALLTRAQEAKAVRDDIGVTEILTLLVAAAQAADHPIGTPETQARALAVMLDGLAFSRAPEARL